MSNEKQADMSKLSTSLKALINAPFAKPGPRPAPKQVQELYEAIANDAAIRNLGPKSWLTVSVRRPQLSLQLIVYTDNSGCCYVYPQLS